MVHAAGRQIDMWPGSSLALSVASCALRAHSLSTRLAKLRVNEAGMCWATTVGGQFLGKRDRTSINTSTPGSTGGPQGRRIQYRPVSGRARQIFLTGPAAIERPAVVPAIPVDTNAGELELF